MTVRLGRAQVDDEIAPALSQRDEAAQLLEGIPAKQDAEHIGVSDRTIRRWRGVSGKIEPASLVGVSS